MANFARAWADFEIEDHRWLVSADGRTALVKWSNENLTHAANLQRLQRDVGTVRSRLVATQLALRQKAKVKFSQVENLFFTPIALEQASSERLADYKAAKFAAIAKQAQDTEVVDLCSGIGGDAISLAKVVGKLTAVDADSICTLYASANLEAFPQVEVRQEVINLETLNCRSAMVHVDPDRRQADRRSTQIEQFSPDEKVLTAILAQSAASAIKLAPGGEIPDAWLDRVLPEWIGENRECKQLVVWSGQFTESIGSRRATAWTADGWQSLTLQPQKLPPVTVSNIEAGSFLLEPHACVLAADLSGAICAEQQLQPLTPAGGYLISAEEVVGVPLLQSFEVVLPVKPKLSEIEKALRSLGGGSVEVKKRGVKLDPNQWQRRLTTKFFQSENHWVLVIYSVGAKEHALICRRANSTDGKR